MSKKEDEAVDAFFDKVVPGVEKIESALSQVDNAPAIGLSNKTSGMLAPLFNRDELLRRFERMGVTERMLRDEAYQRDREDREMRQAMRNRGRKAPEPAKNRQDICDYLFGDGL